MRVRNAPTATEWATIKRGPFTGLAKVARDRQEMTLFEEMVLDALNAGDYKAAIALIAAKEKAGKKC